MKGFQTPIRKYSYFWTGYEAFEIMSRKYLYIYNKNLQSLPLSSYEFFDELDNYFIYRT